MRVDDVLLLTACQSFLGSIEEESKYLYLRGLFTPQLFSMIRFLANLLPDWTLAAISSMNICLGRGPRLTNITPTPM